MVPIGVPHKLVERINSPRLLFCVPAWHVSFPNGGNVHDHQE